MERISKQEYLRLLKKKPKYNNKKTDYTNIEFDSGKEAETARQLDLRVYAKEIDHYERQKRISLDINGHHICTYIADFCIYNRGNRMVEVVETKGFWTPTARLKMKLFKALYPDIKVTLDV